MTYLSDSIPKGSPVLDASVVINILGTGAAEDVFAAVGSPSLVEERTLREVLRHPLEGFDLEASLAGLKDRGHLLEVRMSGEEYQTYLSLVSGPLGTKLGVGESAAMAIAARGACLILDDRKARRRCPSLSSNPALATSVQLMVSCAARQLWPAARMLQLVASARMHARMSISKEDEAVLTELEEAHGQPTSAG